MECGVLVRVLYDFTSEVDGELSLTVGSVLQFIRQMNQHWSYGCLHGYYGNFPTGYVSEIRMPDSVLSKLTTFAHENPQLLVAKNSYRAENSHQLTFEKGDIILGYQTIDDNWWKGALINDCDIGKTKIFPVKHTWKVDMDLLKSSLKAGKTVEMKGKVIMNVKAQLDEEIDLFKDDIVNITEIIDNDWYRGHCNGKSGIFPASVITILQETDMLDCVSGNNSRPSSSLDLLDPFSIYGFSASKNDFESQSFTNNNIKTSTELKDEFSVEDTGRRDVPHARTLYPFKGEFENELIFEAGEVIELKRKVSDDWLEGETSAGQRGIFPKCFVDVIIDLPIEPVDAAALAVNEEEMVGLFDFFPQAEGDVPVMEGERVTLLERTNSDWCKVRNGVGIVGLCPSSYLTSESKQWLQRQWSLPAHSTPSHQRSNTWCVEGNENISKQFTHSVNNNQPSVKNTPKYKSDGVDTEWQLTSVTRRDSCPSSFTKMAPSRPPLPDVIKNITENQKSNTIARIIRPAPAPPTNIHHPPRRSYSAVGTSGRSSVQLRHRSQSSRIKNSSRKRIVTMSEAAAGESTITESFNETAEVEFRNRSGSIDANARNSVIEIKSRKREMIIAELIKTEKDFINDMEFCKRTFMTNPAEEKSHGLDVDILFGNIDPIITVSKRFLKSLEANCNQSSEYKQVGNCFLDVEAEMREAYAKYCCGHDEVIQLLEKYEDDRNLTIYIRQKLESDVCSNNQIFSSLNSLVIKPVQRVLKYPLILKELVNVTEETSSDYFELTTALHRMTEVANGINESRRRKDLVQKYRKDGDTSILSKLSKISFHSVGKKSGRIGMRLSSTLGLASVTKDWIFDEEEQKFREVEKAIEHLLVDMKTFIEVSEENVQIRLKLAELISDFYDSERSQKVIDGFRTVQRVIAANYWPDFKRQIEKRVIEPLIQLLNMFEGPTNLIEKRNDKLLDYDRASQRLEKNKDSTCNKTLRDELELAKKNYTALNVQLLEELPKLTLLTTEILYQCIGAFIYARTRYMGLGAKQLVELAEILPNLNNGGDVLQSFLNNHHEIINRMVALGLILPDSHICHDENLSPKVAAASPSKRKSDVVVHEPQSTSQRAYLQGRYPPDKLFTALTTYSSGDPVEMPITQGDVLAVLIQKDPMGNSDRWFIDNGSTKGLVPAKFLAPLTFSVNETVGKKTEKSEAAQYESVYQHTYQSLKPPPYSEIASRTPSPIYSELTNNYEELSGNGHHRYSDVFDPLGVASDETESLSRPKSASSPDIGLNTNEYFTAAYDFQASGISELSLVRGQVVQIICKQDMEGNQDWWLARDRYGREGYVPGNYLLSGQQQ
ncbi:hypothetical protein CHUAL_004575 [Chamberlinius hualienensis]